MEEAIDKFDEFEAPESLLPAIIQDNVEEMEVEEIPQEQYDEVIITNRPIVIDSSYFTECDDSGGGGGNSSGTNFDINKFMSEIGEEFDDSGPSPSDDDDSEINTLEGTEHDSKASEKIYVRTKNRFS